MGSVLKMKKRILSFALMLCMAITLLPFGTIVAAEFSGTCGENLTWTLDEAGALTISGEGDMTDYTYDSSTGLSDAPWMSYYSVVNSVDAYIKIADSVQSIGDYAFYGLNIGDEYLGTGIKKIGDYAFYGCLGLDGIIIPESVETIGDYAFYDCLGLYGIIIPESVETIGDYAFDACDSLQDVKYNGLCEQWENIKIGEGNRVFQTARIQCLDGSINAPVSSGGGGGGTDDPNQIPDEMSFTVTFYDYDGNVFDTQTVTYGNAAIDPGIPPCSDDTMMFNGWFEDFSYVTSDMNIYPNFMPTYIPPVMYTVTFVDYDGTELKTEMVNAGGSATAPENPTRDGYTFKGWDTDFDFITSDLTVTAQYEEIPATTYTVKFVDYDGSEIDSVTVNENDAAQAPEFAGTKENYTFVGWDKDFSCVTSDLTVTARYERTVTVSGNCGDTVVWKIYADGELEISGSGDTTDYGCNYDGGRPSTPWARHIGKIKKITIKDGITSIGNHLFAYCADAAEITIPSSVTSIGYGAFCGCNELENITIPNSVTSLGGRAFYNCMYIKSITLSENITSIGEYTFYRCYHLENMVIPSGVTSIGQWAFNECSSLESVTIPESVTSIGDRAFDSCSVLAEITIPERVTSIGSYMFRNCHALTNVIIPSGVTSIGSYAFQNCSELKNITIPKSVTSVADNAFLSCAALADVYYGGTETEWKTIAIGANNECLTNAVIHYSGKTEEQDEYTVTFKNYNGDVLKTETVTKGNAATAPDVPKRDGYKFIGWDVDFSNVVSDLTVTARFENSVTASGNINENVSWILYTNGEFAINGSGSMGDFTETTVPWSGDRSKITKVTIADGITNIGAYAFYSCENLTAVSIPETVEKIGEHAFDGCVKLADITIPKTLTEIGTDAFKGCTSMSYIPIPNKGTDIVAGEYENYTNLKNITIPEGVTTVGAAAFRNCSNATSVSIPSTLASIGENAFDGCTSITDVYYNGTESEWESISIADGNSCLTEANIHYLKLTVKFYGFNSVLLKTQTVDMNGAATAPEAPEVDGYTFNGWDKSFESVTSDMTITAIYTSNSTVDPTPKPTPNPTPSTSYTVKFVDYDGTVLKTESVSSGREATAPEAPKRAGYTFVGWDKSFQTVYEDMTVTAQYVVNTPVSVSYTVKFVDYDGKVLKTELVSEGENATAPEAPSREGYIFIGWDKSYTNITTDVTITARYKEKEDETKKITVSKVEASSGDTVTVTVTADENIGMATGGIMINYDRTALELISCDAGNLIKNASCVINKNRNDNGVIKLYANFVSLDNIVAGGELFTMTFKVNENTEDDTHLPITIDKITLNNNEEEVLAVETVNGEIHVLNYELGDVNQNGTVDLLDVFAVMRYDVGLRELSASQKRAADVNGDGTVDIADAFLIQKYDAGLITGFTAE